MPTIEDEPMPIPNAKVPIQDLVVQDIVERKQVGIERYGTPLQTGNGRDMLVDLYQELLDATMYVRGEIEERREVIEASTSDFETLWQAALKAANHGLTPSNSDRAEFKQAAFAFGERCLRLWLAQHPEKVR